jgi:ankyrin repeat protein
VLLEKTDLDFQDHNGKTALMKAAENGNKEICKILLEHGANPDIKDKNNGDTALILASSQGNIDIILMLIEYNATIGTHSLTYSLTHLTTYSLTHSQISKTRNLRQH